LKLLCHTHIDLFPVIHAVAKKRLKVTTQKHATFNSIPPLLQFLTIGAGNLNRLTRVDLRDHATAEFGGAPFINKFVSHVLQYFLPHVSHYHGDFPSLVSDRVGRNRSDANNGYLVRRARGFLTGIIRNRRSRFTTSDNSEKSSHQQDG